MAENNSLGRKIFFLHPSAIIQNQIITELAQDEFEVYAVKDEAKLRKVLKKYPDSIVFANLNDGMKDQAWEEWIRDIMGKPETGGVAIGVIAYETDDAFRKRYTEEIKVQCGFTVMKADTNAVVKSLLVILNAVNAKGRRKFLRAMIENETNITVNFPINGTYVVGIIRDISVVGFSCTFTEDPGLTKNSLFNDIQLRLQSQLLKAEGIVFGSRMDGEQKSYVILFTQRIDPEVRTKVRKYIQSCLQNKMDHELK